MLRTVFKMPCPTEHRRFRVVLGSDKARHYDQAQSLCDIVDRVEDIGRVLEVRCDALGRRYGPRYRRAHGQGKIVQRQQQQQQRQQQQTTRAGFESASLRGSSTPT